MNELKQTTIAGIVLLLKDDQVRADLAAMTAAGGCITVLQQKVAALEALIQSDSDGAINKFNEILDFLAGLDDSEALTLETMLAAKANAVHTHSKSEITDFEHTHDDRYYTEEEIQNLLSGYFTKQAGDELKALVGRHGKRLNTLEAIVPAMNDALPTTYTLEADSNPAFTRVNSGAAERYIQAMGGYMWYKKDNVWYAAKLNSSSWDAFADGTPVTTAIENVCETMIHTPECHYLGNGKTMTFGGLQPMAGGHTFAAPKWNGAYLASVGSDNKLHSRPNTTPAHSRTMTEFWNRAQALDTNAGLSNYQFHCLINALYQARYGNLNYQATVGSGWQHSDWTHCRDVAMGLTKKLGDGTGKVLYNDATVGNQYPTKLFGFEDICTKLWEFRPGIRFYMDGSTRHAVVYDGNVVSNTATGRDISGVLASASGQYANQMELGEYWDMIAKAVSGSDTTYYCDGYWAATGGELLFVGGDAYYLAQCGLSSASSDNGFSYSVANFGARLAFYVDPIIVSGAELVAMIS